MWRRRFEEDWERRKQYLIRSLFEDIPPLSPVPEEDESFDSARRRTIPISRRHVSKTSRPDSPLPPLIIEKEPNRHDEPEAFYKKLEKKILKVYRKLFIEGKSDISSSCDEVRDTNVHIPTEMVCKDIETQSNSLIDDNNLHSDTDTYIEMVEISSVDISAEDLDVLKNSQHFDSNFCEMSNENSFGDDNDNAECMNESNENNQCGEENNDYDQSNSSIEEEELQESGASLELMRQGRKRTISQGFSEISESKKPRTDRCNSKEKSMEEDIHTSLHHYLEDEEIRVDDFRDHRVVQVEADIHINAEEIPQAVVSLVADDFEDNDDVTVVLEEIRVPDNIRSSGGKRSWSSISEESVSFEDAGTQTQCNGRVNNILRDIFVGTPKIFRLCSCVNHFCVC